LLLSSKKLLGENKMKNLRKWSAWLGAGAVVMTLSAGCADRNKNGQPESLATSEETASTVKEGVDATEKAADNAGNAISNSADKMGDAAAKTADQAGTAIAKGADNAADAVTGAGAALTLTSSIKTALGANKGMNGSNIDVDTNGDTKTVSLKGTAKTAAQKNLATAIAKQKAGGFKVNNQLKVAG
jgi:hypothetical protein